MTKVDEYARVLRGLDDPEPYLLEHSHLPGPRGNIELGQAAARVLAADRLRRWAVLDARAAPTGGAEEFLAFCGVLGLGRLLAEGDATALAELRGHAEDPRWRVREAVAMALHGSGGAVRAGPADRSCPGRGGARGVFEALVQRAEVSADRDLRWIARENLRKHRLERLDPAWVATLRTELD